MADNVALPAGFVLDSEPKAQPQSTYLPPGFVVDQQPSQTQPEQKTGMDWGAFARDIVHNYARPALEGAGLVVGGALGAGGGTIVAPGAGTVGGGVAGAGLGYAAGSQAADAIEAMIDPTKGKTLPQAAAKAVTDTATGAAMEAGGQLAGKGLELVSNKVIKPAITQMLGATTGSGPGAIETAAKGGEAFTDAMRGKTTGDEIVDNVRSALSTLKEQRAQAYRSQLEKVASNEVPLDTGAIKTKLANLMNQYGVKIAEDGTVDTSRVAMGKAGRKDIEEIIDNVSKWGSREGDNTAIGLDTLKRQLDDFFSESSQARQFVTSLRNTVKQAIVDNVPEYADMTKGYSRATDLIKEIEKGLMLKSNQTTDQTLRRLTSAMREGFDMRRDLVDALGDKTSKDLSGQIAGYSMSQFKPRGIAGTAPALTMEALAAVKFLDPKFWPLLAASSPRAVGEFLNVFGSAVRGSAAQGAKAGLREGLAYAVGSKMNPSKTTLSDSNNNK